MSSPCVRGLHKDEMQYRPKPTIPSIQKFKKSTYSATASTPNKFNCLDHGRAYARGAAELVQAHQNPGQGAGEAPGGRHHSGRDRQACGGGQGRHLGHRQEKDRHQARLHASQEGEEQVNRSFKDFKYDIFICFLPFRSKLRIEDFHDGL